MGYPETQCIIATTAALLFMSTPMAIAAISAGNVFHICRRSDPQLGECMKQSMQEFLPSLLKGMPELKLPKHEPLFLPKITLKQGQGPVSLDSTFTDQYIHGFSNMKIKSAKADLDKNEIEFEFASPALFIEGNYSMDGRILLVPMKGEGYGRTNYTGVSGKAVLRGHRETRKGREYLEIDELKLDLHVKKAKFQLDNLFNGDKVLGETVSRLLEENWELLFTEMKPVVDEGMGALLGNSVKTIFKRFPLDELLPQ